MRIERRASHFRSISRLYNAICRKSLISFDCSDFLPLLINQNTIFAIALYSHHHKYTRKLYHTDESKPHHAHFYHNFSHINNLHCLAARVIHNISHGKWYNNTTTFIYRVDGGLYISISVQQNHSLAFNYIYSRHMYDMLGGYLLRFTTAKHNKLILYKWKK